MSTLLSAVWEALQARSEAIAAERQRYLEFFAHAPEAVTDGYWSITEANHAACELVQRSAAALTGKPIACLIPLLDRRDFRRRLAELAGPAIWRASLLPGPTQIICSVRPIRGTGYAWVLRPAA